MNEKIKEIIDKHKADFDEEVRNFKARTLVKLISQEELFEIIKYIIDDYESETESSTDSDNTPNPCNIADVTVDLNKPHVLIKDIFINTDGVFCEIKAIDPYKEFLQFLSNEMNSNKLFVCPFIKRTPQENEIINFTTYYGLRPALSSIERAKEHGSELIEYLSLDKKNFYSMKLYSYREEE